ncbi:hypothetical protein D3C81_1374820 [compost metagenome]
MLLHLAHGQQQAATVAVAQRHLAREVAVGDLRGDGRRIVGLAAQLLGQLPRQEPAQQYGKPQATHHQDQHQHARAVIDAGRFVHIGLGALVATLDHLEQHVFQRAAVLEQVSALGEHGGLELRRVQRLLADQRHILLHALAEGRQQRFILLDHCLAFRRRERVLGGLHARLHGGQRFLDGLALGGALAHRRGGQQRDLRAAGVDEVDIAVLHGLQCLQVAVVDLAGPFRHAPHIDNAQQADDGADYGNDQEAGNEPGRNAQLIEPLHRTTPFCQKRPGWASVAASRVVIAAARPLLPRSWRHVVPVAS